VQLRCVHGDQSLVDVVDLLRYALEREGFRVQVLTNRIKAVLQRTWPHAGSAATAGYCLHGAVFTPATHAIGGCGDVRGCCAECGAVALLISPRLRWSADRRAPLAARRCIQREGSMYGY
jgi:hypothetical protein